MPAQRTSGSVPVADLSARARIRETALELFGRHGPRATSIRMVAAGAGVSPGAVVHHYPSKADLEEAVREEVLARFREAFHDVGLDEPTVDALHHRRAAASAFLAENPVVSEYLRHVYADGGDEALALFEAMARTQRDEMQSLVDAGLARPLPDPDAGLFLYQAVTMATILLRPLIERVLDVSLDDPDVQQRFRAAEVDFLTQPLFPVRTPKAKATNTTDGRRGETGPGGPTDR